MEKENQLFILKPGMKAQELNNTISNAIEQGYVIIYENVEETIDFNIQTLLQRQTRVLHNKKRLRFMGQEYELNDNFRFYMTTKLSRPHFSSEICVLTTILNFQVTAFGLEDQMLNILVAKEDPSSE
jgi:dynein heavy chain